MTRSAQGGAENLRGSKQLDRARFGEELFSFLAANAAHDFEPSSEPGILSQLHDSARGAVHRVGHCKDDGFDVAGEKRADAHRAGLPSHEDRGVGKAVATELSSGLADGNHHGMGGRIVRHLHPVMSAGHHRIVDDGYCADRSLALIQRDLSFGQSLAHEQLVIHASIIQVCHGPERPAGRRS